MAQDDTGSASAQAPDIRPDRSLVAAASVAAIRHPPSAAGALASSAAAQAQTGDLRSGGETFGQALAAAARGADAQERAATYVYTAQMLVSGLR